MPRKYTKVAIVYDFDGTLAKGNIQENSFLPAIGIPKGKFWGEVKDLARNKEMDEILAYMFLLIKKADKTKTMIDKESIRRHGAEVVYFNGVKNFFNEINAYAKSQQVNLQHYIVSSGTKEMIEGTSIAKEFKYIYASSFMYDQHGVPEWPAVAINYTTKVQYLFRINKGIHNAWDNSKINEYTPEEDRPIPFSEMIYIGDGATDIPAMKMILYKGGHAIAVYPPSKKHAKKEATKLLKQKRASYVVMADYSKNKGLYKIVKSIISQISFRKSIAKFGKS